MLAVALLLHCSPSDELPPLQTVALDADRAALRQFEGRWFDAFDGYLMAAVRGGDRPQFSIRLSEELRLESASLEDGELLFRFQGSAGNQALCLLPVGENELVLIPPGGSPSWCGTCTPYLERNRSPLKVAGRRATGIAETLWVAHDATWAWLVDVL
jgi:hypothetical protein